MFSRIVCNNCKGLFNNFPKNSSFPKRRFRQAKKEKDFSTPVIEPYEVNPSEPAKLSSLIRPFLFTVGFSGFTLCATSIWQYENMLAKARSEWKSQKQIIINNYSDSPIFQPFFSEQNSPKAGKWRNIMNHYFNNLQKSDKVFLSILAANLIVFGAWRIPRLQGFMLRYFASTPISKSKCLPLFLSTFSHSGLFHLLANMYVLHSFSKPLMSILGEEQFVAAYLIGGVTSSFVSAFYKVLIGSTACSIGASGAILALIGIFASAFPNHELGIIFLPGFTFYASSAIKGIFALDFIGCLARWRIFDHAAHLGGLSFGVWWAHYGCQDIWGQRARIMVYWDQIVRSRGKTPPSP